MMQATLQAMQEFFESQVHGIRRLGAASLDLCMVADGMLGAFFEYQLCPWDFAAAGLIVEEAGGWVTTGLGHPVPLQSTSLLASNGSLHSSALQIVGKHHP
jgi:myo-inositol-1(or 4)-monophosphatase